MKSIPIQLLSVTITLEDGEIQVSTFPRNGVTPDETRALLAKTLECVTTPPAPAPAPAQEGA